MNDKQLLFEEYKLAIDTQMHFNDMLWKMRSLMLTTVLAVFTVAITMAPKLPASTPSQNETAAAAQQGGGALQDELGLSSAEGVVTIESLSLQLQQATALIEELRSNPVSPRAKADVVVVWAGMLFILLVFILDVLYFYRLLLGAVERSEAIEKTAKGRSLELDTTGSISKRVPRWLAHTGLAAFYAIPVVAGLLYVLCLRNLLVF